MNPVISQLEALITRLDRQRAHIELLLMDQTRQAQEQEQLEQTSELLFELRQTAATSLAVVERVERELGTEGSREWQRRLISLSCLVGTRGASSLNMT
jgi:hypothetical protein